MFMQAAILTVSYQSLEWVCIHLGQSQLSFTNLKLGKGLTELPYRQSPGILLGVAAPNLRAHVVESA